jgi:flagella synthesis protein FlgN
VNDALTGTELAHSLTLERDAVNAFVAILQREQDALIQGRSEDLDSLASSKARMVKQLAEFGERRNRYLASRGLAPDSKGMDAWLAESPASAERSGASAAVWSDLLRLARFAQQLNQTNGAIIATRLQNCQRAFAALQGAAGTTALYGPKGQTFGVGSRRALGFR